MPRSTTSSLFPDVNVWLALSYARHVHHAAAKGWFEGLGEGPDLHFCSITQLGLLRLLTTTAVMGVEVLTQPRAWEVYDRWLHDGRVVRTAEPPGLEAEFRALTRRPHPSPHDWADAYLAAFARSAGLTLVTFDLGLARRVPEALALRG